MHIFIYRLSAGRLGGNMNGFKVLILNTTGRKSGKLHSNPVGYFERAGGYLVVACYGEQANHPGWLMDSCNFRSGTTPASAVRPAAS